MEKVLTLGIPKVKLLTTYTKINPIITSPLMEAQEKEFKLLTNLQAVQP
jgi:hypothetical protein